MRERDGSTAWPLLALPVALGVDLATGVVRLSSGLGWVLVWQCLLVVPWVAPLLLPIAFHVTRRRVADDRGLVALLAVAAAAVFLSGFTQDSTDQSDCFLGACSGQPEPWWWHSDLVWATPFVSVGLSVLAVALELVALTRRRRVATTGGPLVTAARRGGG